MSRSIPARGVAAGLRRGVAEHRSGRLVRRARAEVGGAVVTPTLAEIADAVRREVYAAIRDVNAKMGAVVAGPWDGRVEVLPIETPPKEKP